MRAGRNTPHDRTASKGRPGGELSLIRAIGARAAAGSTRFRRELKLGIGDDCAIVRPRPREEIVVTTDFSLEGRHFRRDWHSPESIGHRVLARGLSDLAAMGARPVAAFLSLALPRPVAGDKRWMDRFLGGLLRLADRAPVPLAGGDTAEAPGDEILADIVLLGAVPQERALRRDGARARDRLYVTGALGGAAVQLAGLRNGERQRALKEPGAGKAPHFFPEPRLATGQRLLRGGKVTAAIDLSDGLSTDLAHLCAASHVTAEVFETQLPLHPLTRGMTPDEALRAALHGGEDYELLFAADPKARLPRLVAGVPITEIGRLAEPQRGRPAAILVDSFGKRQPLLPGGWEHLR